jgi:phosphopantetheine attachment domain protein
MNEKIDQILKGIIEESILLDIKKNLESYLDTKIVSLGVDSLVFMDLVFNIEKAIGKEIDFTNFDIDSISTIGKIIDFIKINEQR